MEVLNKTKQDSFQDSTMLNDILARYLIMVSKIVLRLGTNSFIFFVVPGFFYTVASFDIFEMISINQCSRLGSLLATQTRGDYTFIFPYVQIF